MTDDSDILRRLRLLRGTVRRRLVLYGVCALLAGGVGAFLAAVVLDWLLRLPPLLRVGVGAVFVVGFVGATLHWLVKPLQARLGMDELAARLEAHFEALRDRLSSTVDFLERRDAGSESLMREVIARTERLTADLPLESTLTLRPLVLRGLLLLSCSGLLGACYLLSPDWVRTGFFRYVHPWGRIEWPRAVSVQPLTGDLIAAVGESVTVRMHIRRGLHDSLRGVVRLREHDGETTSLAMQREEVGTFFSTIDAVTKDLTYWFEAGDDSTVERPSQLHVVRRPQVVDAIATIEPPPYAAERPVHVADLADGPVRAPIGGHVRLTVQASKPIPQQPADAGAGLRMENGAWIPMTIDRQDPRELSAGLAITGDMSFRIELRDEHGFENRGATRHSILAKPDVPPVVTVLEPKAVTEVTPKGSVPLLVRVDDDFGITRLDLEVQRDGDENTVPVPLTDRLEAAQDRDGFAALASYVWSVEPLAVVPGDVLTYTVVATDNRSTADSAGQVGRSDPMHIRIISDLEFDIRVRSDVASLETRLRQAALDQADLLDRTTAIVPRDGETAGLTAAQRESAAALAARQARLVRRLRDLARRFREIVGRMERNHAGDEETRARIDALSGTLQEIAGGPMTVAGGALGPLREPMRVDAQRRSLEEAVRAEETAVDGLQALIRLMAQWGSFHELITRTRDLVDRQEALRTTTAQLSRGMLGKPVESLTEAESARLQRAVRRQEQLHTDVEQLLEQMGQLGNAARDKDPASADSMDAALRAARAHDLVRSIRDAARSIEANRTAAATVHQRAAADALRQMVAALRERETRELELLRKRVDRAEEQVTLLIEQQEALRMATHEAGLVSADESALRSLEQEQRIIKRNTGLLGEELIGLKGATVAARLVRRAATPMGRAETQLREQEPEAATVEQDEALALLRSALERFEKLAQEAAQEALMRTLAQIREDLNEIKAAQLEVNRGIGQLKADVESRGRVSRREARAASKLAREQTSVRAMVDRQRVDFEQVTVYAWALERVVTWMDSSRSRLDGRRIDGELVAVTARIVRELEKLVNAIVETQALPVDTAFVESAVGGGAGSAQVDPSRPVPTVAELVVLKAMQADINERTRVLRESFRADDATEEQLREVQILGEDQAEVRRLTERVTRQTQHP